MCVIEMQASSETHQSRCPLMKCHQYPENTTVSPGMKHVARLTKNGASSADTKNQPVETEAGPVCHRFSRPLTVKVKLWQLQPTLNYAESRQGDHYVTSAAPPSAGELIACSSVWLALNERMWVTMRFSPGAATAWGGGRSWIWNNETVNALYWHYWFSQAYILCPWYSSTTVTDHM